MVHVEHDSEQRVGPHQMMPCHAMAHLGYRPKWQSTLRLSRMRQAGQPLVLTRSLNERRAGSSRDAPSSCLLSPLVMLGRNKRCRVDTRVSWRCTRSEGAAQPGQGRGRGGKDEPVGCTFLP